MQNARRGETSASCQSSAKNKKGRRVKGRGNEGGRNSVFNTHINKEGEGDLEL